MPKQKEECNSANGLGVDGEARLMGWAQLSEALLLALVALCENEGKEGLKAENA